MNADFQRGTGRKRGIFDALFWMDDPVPRAGPLNMAIDEVLLAGFAETGDAAWPILRVYRWSGLWASIGYFEPVESATEALPGYKLVRRWTGGGIVEHGNDLTYSLLVPRALTPPGWRAEDAYNRIHEAVAAALQAAGLDGVTLSPPTAPGSTSPGAASSYKCFKKPVTHDVLLAGHKIAGAAQRRTRHGLLHQGSIQNKEADPDRGFAPGGALHSAVCARLPSSLASCFQARPLTSEELTRATGLAAGRYDTPEWLQKF